MKKKGTHKVLSNTSDLDVSGDAERKRKNPGTNTKDAEAPASDGQKKLKCATKEDKLLDNSMSSQYGDDYTNLTDCAACKEELSGFQVACDLCDLWFHGKCVRISTKQKNKHFYCKTCIENPSSHYEELLKLRVARTKLEKELALSEKKLG